MTVRVRYRIEASVSSTTAEERDLGNVVYEVVNDTMGEGGVRKTTLAPAASDVSLALADVASARFVVVRTNTVDATATLGIIEVKKNTVGNEIHEIVPLPGATEAHMVWATQDITALFASNPGTVAVEITVMSAGD